SISHDPHQFVLVSLLPALLIEKIQIPVQGIDCPRNDTLGIFGDSLLWHCPISEGSDCPSYRCSIVHLLIRIRSCVRQILPSHIEWCRLCNLLDGWRCCNTSTG